VTLVRDDDNHTNHSTSRLVADRRTDKEI